MPLFTQLSKDDFQLSVWRIEEELSFFEAKFNAHPEIQNESKKLQWFATRHLLNEMVGDSAHVWKDDTGKPFLKDASHHISISHTPEFAAAIASKQNIVGIDLEMITPKVERIAHKFLRDDEIDAIGTDEKLEKLILYWSAKEALYKLYGKKQIEFKTQLLIEPFTLELNGHLRAEIITGDEHIRGLTVNYSFFEDHVVSYVMNEIPNLGESLAQ